MVTALGLALDMIGFVFVVNKLVVGPTVLCYKFHGLWFVWSVGVLCVLSFSVSFYSV